MRLLAISNYYPPQYVGGYELRCQQTVNALREAGYEVHVLTTQAEVRENDPQVHRLLQPVFWSDPPDWREKLRTVRQRTQSFYDNYTAARELLERLRPRGVLQWNPAHIGLGGAAAAHQLGIPVIYFVGDMSIAHYWQLFQGQWLRRYALPVRWIGRALQRSMIQMGRLLEMRFAVFNSQHTRQVYAQRGLVAEEGRVVYNGIRYAALAPEQLSQPERFALLCVGRIAEVKGVHVAIEALYHLHQHHHLPQAYLSIAGDGERDYLERLQQQVRERGLESHVHFLGKVSPDQLPDLYRRHRVLLFPVLWEEPFGLVLPEAMAHGLPAVASRSGAVPEIVRDGQEGFLVERGDALEMAERAACLIQDDPLWQQMRLRGLQRVRESFTGEVYLHQVLEFIRQVVG